METIPLEILSLIAAELNAHDLKSFRLVIVKWASVGASLVARNGISILNTADCLQELSDFLDSELVHSARKFTIFHGEWPRCSRQEWETHPLLRGGNDRSNLVYVQDRYALKADKAFREYSNFIKGEEGRRYWDDVYAINRALEALSNINTVNISHIQTWHPSHNSKYQDLQSRIWMAPTRQDGVSSAVQTFLLAFGQGYPNITSIAINGTFDATDVHLSGGTTFSGIQKLQVTSFKVLQSQEDIRLFLQAFPNLTHLSIGFQGWGPSIPDIIGRLFWPKLKVLKVNGIWASQQEILAIFEHHQSSLEEFTLNHAALTQGSWKSLFTKIRHLNTQVHVSAEGELYGRRSKDTLILHHAATARLLEFMKDLTVLWPFGQAES
jgi:hypothetical protein